MDTTFNVPSVLCTQNSRLPEPPISTLFTLPVTPNRDSESLAITYDVMATTRLIVYLNASFAITGNVKDRSFNLAENCNKGQRMPRLPLFARFPTSSTQRRCCIWRGCTALRRACLARRPELCRRPTLALQRRAVHRSYRHFQGCLSNLKRDKFPRQLLHPNSMRFRSKPYRSLCGTANHCAM